MSRVFNKVLNFIFLIFFHYYAGLLCYKIQFTVNHFRHLIFIFPMLYDVARRSLDNLIPVILNVFITKSIYTTVVNSVNMLFKRTRLIIYGSIV